MSLVDTAFGRGCPYTRDDPRLPGSPAARLPGWWRLAAGIIPGLGLPLYLRHAKRQAPGLTSHLKLPGSQAALSCMTAHAHEHITADHAAGTLAMTLTLTPTPTPTPIPHEQLLQCHLRAAKQCGHLSDTHSAAVDNKSDTALPRGAHSGPRLDQLGVTRPGTSSWLVVVAASDIAFCRRRAFARMADGRAHMAFACVSRRSLGSEVEVGPGLRSGWPGTGAGWRKGKTRARLSRA